ncbi:hypothetical protein ACNTMW_26120 [Planosporangium sp. 12N6]|uniref:hypothetical protein n=1 Tax=Planosporangium spinosum TaxID=3402278 RepID=UPI003CF4BF68
MSEPSDADLRAPAQPGTVVDVPYGPLGRIVAAVAVVALGATGYAQRRIRQADPSEVPRDTT